MTDRRRPKRRVIRRPEVRTKTGLSDSTIWRRELAGEFPLRIALSPNTVGWYEDEIDAWLASRPRSGGDSTAAA